MVAYFPNIYPDELLYSVIARYYDHSGYLSFKYAAKQIFLNPTMRVEKEFMKNLNKECLQIIEKQMPIKKLIEKHTMVPYYIRFYDADRKKNMIDTMKSQNQDCSKLIGKPQNRTGKKRYLRLCPCCIENDRGKYGECYFHRTHQMWNVAICPEHYCNLVETDIPLDVSGTSIAISAEQAEPSNISNKEQSHSQIEIKYAVYNQKLLNLSLEVDMSRIADFIIQKLSGTRYLSIRGEHKYYSRLYADMVEYYKDTSILKEVEKMHIQRTLMGTRLIFHEVVAILVFLDVPIEELSELRISEFSPEQQFDKKVSALKKQGFSRNAIARQLKVSTSVIDYAIEEKIAKCVKRQGNITNTVDWNEKDVLYFPQTKKIVDRLLSDSASRPQNISMYKIRKELEIPQHWIEQMPECKKYVEDVAMKTNDTVDIRAVAWAIREIRKNDKDIRLWKICSRVKIGEDRIISAIIHYPEFLKEDDYKRLMDEINMKQEGFV